MLEGLKLILGYFLMYFIFVGMFALIVFMILAIYFFVFHTIMLWKDHEWWDSLTLREQLEMFHEKLYTPWRWGRKE